MFLIPSFIIPTAIIHSKRTLLRQDSMRTAITVAKAAEGILNASSSVEDLLSHVKTLSPVNQRAISAVVGAAVGDAATRPFHWLYDRSKLEEIVGDNDPSFWPFSMSPFYTLPTGRRSCYNDLGFCMLQSMEPFQLQSTAPQIDQIINEKTSGGFQKENFLSTMATFFSDSSEYGQALKRRKAAYDPAKRLDERVPVDGPWQQGAVTSLMDHVSKGEEVLGSPDSKETDGLCVTIPLICRLAAEERSLPTSTSTSSRSLSLPENSKRSIIEASSLLSSNLFAQTHTLAAARVLRSIILHGNTAGTVDAVRSAILDGQTIEINSGEDNYLEKELKEVIESLESNTPHTDSVEKWGRQCANPGSFMGAMLSFCTSTRTGASVAEGVESKGGVALGYCEGIKMVIKGGGCNCSRSNLSGALLGAYFGLQHPHDIENENGIPLEWMRKTDKISEILYLAISKVSC